MSPVPTRQAVSGGGAGWTEAPGLRALVGHSSVGAFCDIPPPWPLLVSGLTVKVEDPKYKKDKQLNEKISLFRGDITKLEVDAIVNAGEWGSWPP